ncbi:DsbA family oxidoreductase [Schaalia vaccimaxillae]|uniref:DsbA family oxidoreductase n=1 Tax=Schaalia vaccimaxillae TaxID=183916 RepID=UPI0003FF9EF4|nr:DsbA family oxidoreductase [Schaalia vaccimaxillae]
MHIDVWADVACPWSYLGIRHLRTALSEFEHRDEVEVVIHAYFLDPQLEGPLDISRSEYLESFGSVSAEQIEESNERLRKLGRAEGVVFAFDNVIVAPTSNAHRAIALAHELDIERDTVTGPDTTALKLFEALSRSYLEMGLNLADPDVVIGCAQDIGMEADNIVRAMAEEHYAAKVFSDFQIGVQMGIDLVPTYLFDRALVVQDHQPVTAMRNILSSAWDHKQQEQQS